MVLRFREIVICLCFSCSIFFTTTAALTSSIQFPKTFENLEMVQVLRESYLEFFKTDLNITDEKLAKEMVVKLLPDTYCPFTTNLRFENEKSFDHFKQSLRQNIKNTFSQPKYKDLTDLLRNNASEIRRIGDSFEEMKDDIYDIHDLQKKYNEISSLNKQVTETLPDFIKAIENLLSDLNQFSTDYRTSILYTDFEKTALILVDLLQNPKPAKLEKDYPIGIHYDVSLETFLNTQIFNNYASAANALFDKIFIIDGMFYHEHLVPFVQMYNSFKDNNIILKDKILKTIIELTPKSNVTYTVDSFFVFLKDAIEKREDLLKKKYNDSKYFFNEIHIYTFLNGYAPEKYLCKIFLDATKDTVKSTKIKHFPNHSKASQQESSAISVPKSNNSDKKNSDSCLIYIIVIAIVIFSVIIIVVTVAILNRSKKQNYRHFRRHFI